MKYYTVVNEVEALQIAYAVCVCVCSKCVCFSVQSGGLFVGGGGDCGDNAAIKKWSLSRENEHSHVRTEKRQRGETSAQQNELREEKCETRNKKQKDGEKEKNSTMWAAETIELSFLMAVYRAPRAE